MNVLAIVGSPRKKKSTDFLIDAAIDGVRSKAPQSRIKKLHLLDYKIKLCKNCLQCRDRVTDDSISPCVIHDDMDHLCQDVSDSDSLLFGTPVHMGYATALMMIFLERICWTFAKPEGKVFPLSGCPVPRSKKHRNALIILTSGIVPPLLRTFCDQATPLIKQTIKDSLNASTIGTLYAGDIEHRGVDSYYSKAFKLGVMLGK